MRRVISGPQSAKILIVGEAPGENEDKTGLPFMGASGNELTRMLGEAGIDREAVRLANVCNIRPPKNDISAFMPDTKKEAIAAGATLFNGRYVTKEIIEGCEALRSTVFEMPNLELVIALGNTPLWALAGQKGITKWRGSQLKINYAHREKLPLVPVMHPAAILRQWQHRFQAVGDLKRAIRWQREGFNVPSYDFTVRPSFADVNGWLLDFAARNLVDGKWTIPDIAVDLETRQGHIACIGLADSDRHAICIPLMESSGSYWSLEEETHIMWRLYNLLLRCRVIGQNFLYDQQYLARRYGWNLRAAFDTMVAQHVCFPGVPKGLDYISSVYCHYHTYWKDESKDWAPALGESQLWTYNCKDAVVTYEAKQALSKFLEAFGFQQQFQDQMENCDIAFEAMLRGVRVDFAYRARLATHDELEDSKGNPLDHGLIAKQMLEIKALLKEFLGVPIEPSSSKQVHWLCYEILKLPPIKKPGTGNLTADKDAIAEWLRSCEPLYRPILQMIADFRSLQVFRSTFARAPIDKDGRFRCSIHVAGPETYRYSTGADAFGFGTNMQNIPAGDD